MHRTASVVSALALLILGLGGGRLASQTFDEALEVVLVEVPVQVVREGEPVRGLSRDDFELFDGRKRQEISIFQVIDLGELSARVEEAGRPAPLLQIPISARRHFLFLFDLSFSQPGSIVRARDAARELIRNGLHATDLVAVATYTVSQGPRLLLGFTSDRAQADLAIDTLGLPELARARPDPFGLVFGDLQRLGAADAAEGERADFFAQQLHDVVQAIERDSRQQDVNRLVAVTRSLADLGALMSSVRGRKQVVYLSEGFDTSMLLGTGDQEAQDEMTEAAQEGRYWEVDSEARFGSTRAQGELEEMLEAFRRADCAIQAVDIGGLRGVADAELGSAQQVERSQARLDGRQHGLFTMAAETGGELYRNFNNLSAAMGQMLARTGVTYLLAFQVEKPELDGRYHRLRVRLKDAPKGTRASHRPGYFSPRPYSELSAAERQFQGADLLIGGQEGGAIEAAVLASPFRVAGEAAYVPVIVEIGGASLLRSAGGDLLPVEVSAYAFDADGAVGDYLSFTFGFDLTGDTAKLEQGGFKFYGHLNLEPGEYALRVLARNSANGVTGLASVSLEVPDFAAGGPVLLPPFFADRADRWLLVRDQEREAGGRLAYPFVAGEQSFIPAVRPVLAAGETAAVTLMAYDFVGEELQVDSRVVAADGEAIEGPSLAGLTLTRGAQPGMAALSGSLALGPTPPGEYRLEVSVTDPTSGRTATSSSPFGVAGSS